ncbi:MAG: response regulator [Candidatus Zixiibacteriota bacterium]|nr:MAG: response regulator [candidate division Zixibacteria bacterium]
MQTIIIADDSSTARMVTRRCLEIAGYQQARILDARDGREALVMVKSQGVDLLVTDLNMPGMDGTSLLRHIKSSPRLHNLPVLVISSMGNAARQEELLRLGAFAVLDKPVSPAAIVRALKELEATEEREA